MQSFCFLNKFSYSHQYEWSKELLDSTLWRSCKPKSSSPVETSAEQNVHSEGKAEVADWHREGATASGTNSFWDSWTAGHSLGRLEHRPVPHPAHILHLLPSDFHHPLVLQTKCYVYALNISQDTTEYNTSGSVFIYLNGWGPGISITVEITYLISVGKQIPLNNGAYFIQYTETSYPLFLPQSVFPNPLTSFSRWPFLRIRLTELCQHID